MKHGLMVGMFAVGLSLTACSSDESAETPAGDGDGVADGADGTDGTSGDGEPQSDAGRDAGGDGDMDASAQLDAGGDAGPGTHFTVPSEGGSVAVTMPSGETVSFEFPASAAGQDITIAPTTVAPEGFQAENFAALIDLSPDGLTFVDPVRVTLGNGALMAFNFAHGAQVPDPLELSEDKQALLLTHFSTLALIDPNLSCQSTSGWRDEADASACSDFGPATTLRSFACKNYQYCYVMAADCCVEPGDTSVGCKVDSPKVTLEYTRTDSNGGDYPYCDAPEPDAGPTAECVIPAMPNGPGICNETQGGGCQCAMDYDDGAGYKTYVMTCTANVCECRLDGALKGDGAAAGVCMDQASMQAAYAQYCCPNF